MAPAAGAKTGGPEGSARLSFEGNATDQIVNATATLVDLPLGAAGPYLADFMTPVVSGNLNAELGVTWKAGKEPAQSTELLLQSPQLTLDNAALDGDAVTFLDKSLGKPVSFDFSALAMQLKNVSSAGSKPFQVHVATQIRAGCTQAGRLDWRGSAWFSPLAVQGRVEAVRVPVHAFELYLADNLNIELLRADTSFRGQVSYAQNAAGLVLKINGDTSVEDFLANTLPGSQGAMAAAAGAPAVTPGPLQIGEELLR